MTVPVNVVDEASPAAEPVATTGSAVPEPLKEKPYVVSAEKVQVPPAGPAPDAETVQRGAPVGPVRATWVSDDAKPATLAVTLTPLGPPDGLRVRLVTVPVKVVL